MVGAVVVRAHIDGGAAPDRTSEVVLNKRCDLRCNSIPWVPNAGATQDHVLRSRPRRVGNRYACVQEAAEVYYINDQQ